VSIYETLVVAGRFASDRRRVAGLEGEKEEQQLWISMQMYRHFISVTGQAYQFENYLEGHPPTPRPYVSSDLWTQQGSTAQKLMALLLKAFDETPEKQPVSVLIHMLNFIADTGQFAACEDYVDNSLDYAPLTIAHFATREEADAWHKGLAEPPSPAHILIGDEYYTAVYAREDNTRFISREYVIEPYIAELTARGIPPTAPAFKTRAEAEAWLENHPANPFAFVSIAGEYHFAVNHKRLKRHTLHPVASSLAALEEWKKRSAEREQTGDEEAEKEDE
jgi:hypothetical protein